VNCLLTSELHEAAVRARASALLTTCDRLRLRLHLGAVVTGEMHLQRVSTWVALNSMNGDAVRTLLALSAFGFEKVITVVLTLVATIGRSRQHPESCV
jgi:hypothetical protein